MMDEDKFNQIKNLLPSTMNDSEIVSVIMSIVILYIDNPISAELLIKEAMDNVANAYVSKEDYELIRSKMH